MQVWLHRADAADLPVSRFVAHGWNGVTCVLMIRRNVYGKIGDATLL
jgi:hypothetical protein